MHISDRSKNVQSEQKPLRKLRGLKVYFSSLFYTVIERYITYNVVVIITGKMNTCFDVRIIIYYPLNTILLIKASLFFNGDKMEQINIKLSEKLLKQMDDGNEKTGVNRSEYIRRLIQKDVE